MKYLFYGHNVSSYCTGKMRHLYLSLALWFAGADHKYASLSSAHTCVQEQVELALFPYECKC